jgi:hypothetical protein
VLGDCTSPTLAWHAHAAVELGISSTLAFLVNGRLLDGSLPEADFEALIRDELQRVGGRPKQSPQGAAAVGSGFSPDYVRRLATECDAERS